MKFAALFCALALTTFAHAEGVKRALLIGCTTYPNLPESLQLEGPGNDVQLLRMLLTTRLGFDDKNVAVFTEEGAATNHLPTRANIEKAFQDLAAAAGKDDQVVVLMAGHGSQQPDVNPSANDPEPDGLDEIYLPRDAAKWNSAKSSVENSIRDDEIRTWLLAILKKGAHVCALIDACHSGSMVRGAGVERLRQVAPDLLVPADELKKARANAGKTPASTTPVADEVNLGDVPNWVAIYAAQSTEPTVERLLPPRGGEGKMYGLLTFTMTQILLNAHEPISYADLGRRIRAQYASWGRTFPTPLVEGTDIDRQVFGAAELTKPQPITFKKVVANGFPRYEIDRGTIGGMLEGTILALWPAAGETRVEKPLGYLTIRAAHATDAEVKACEFNGVPVLDPLPTTGQCEVAQTPAPSVKLAIKADGEAAPEVTRALDALYANQSSGFVEAKGDPDWLVRVAQGAATLVPGQGVAGEKPRGLDTDVNAFGPHKVDAGFGSWLTEATQRIARAQTLLRLADPATAGEMPKVKTTLLVEGKEKSDARAGTELHAGDMISFEITNESQIPLDVSLLFIDSGYGITALYPPRGLVEDNRLPPGRSLKTKRFKVTQATTGLEHAVVLAVKGEGAPADFSFLEQPTMTPETTRGASGGGVLRELIRGAVYQQGKTRGLAPAETAEFAIEALSWRVRP